MPNIDLMLNNKHEFRILQCWQYNLQCEEVLYHKFTTVFQNDDNSSILGQSCKSD